jgi:hypothetical protein
MSKFALVLLALVLALGCNSGTPARPTQVAAKKRVASTHSNSKPVVHVLVALCDNKYQGIVPVSARLGNGDDLKDNLYWGSMYGVKAYFTPQRGWKRISSTKNPKPGILERIILRNSSGTTLVADAYRGRNIQNAIEDFLSFTNGFDPQALHNSKQAFGGGSDMLVFLGHDGLMDFRLPVTTHTKLSAPKSVAILCCKSKKFFEPHIRPSAAKPILWTKSLMAPEAYVLEASIQSFERQESSAEAIQRAARAYSKYQNCSLKAVRSVFTSGY